MDKNLYYHPTDSHWMDEHLLKMQAVGQEKASLFGDPLFVDPAGGDFSFRPDSPALTLGIEPLDVSKMGRMKRDKEREADPAQGETPDSPEPNSTALKLGFVPFDMSKVSLCTTKL
jgi:hypothetical protein